MLDIPEEMSTYVNNYKILLVEARENNLVLHNANNRDLFNLLEILLNEDLSRNQKKESAIEYGKVHNVDKTVAMAVAGATNVNLDYRSFEKGDGQMISVFEEIAKEAEAKGIIETGFEFGLSECDVLERLQKKLDISLQTAQEYLMMFGEQPV